MEGKTVLITGATSGIGKEMARALVERGAHVVIVGRDPDKTERVQKELSTKGGVEAMIADLSSMSAVRRLAADFKRAHSRLDVLINNAGGIFGKRTVTPEGLELTFAVNHMAYFILTLELLDVLKASAPARIISVSSGAHASADLDLDDLQLEQRYSQQRAYGNSKLANLLFTFELARRLEGTGVTANALHPGVVSTGFGRSGSPLVRVIVFLIRPFMLSAKKGADTGVYLATSDEVAEVTGRYFYQRKPVTPTRAARDVELARAFWERSEALAAGSVSVS